MTRVFVDTSAFYALLDATDPYHPNALEAFRRAAADGWKLETTNYVLHEAWALIQNRLGWPAVDAFLNRLLPLCKIIYVDADLHARGAARCRQARSRYLSLTDCISFEYMRDSGLTRAFARDDHFAREGFQLD